jgi:hypothetical protein
LLFNRVVTAAGKRSFRNYPYPAARGTNSRIRYIMRRIDPLPGNDSVYTFQRTRNNGSCVLCGPRYSSLLDIIKILTTEEVFSMWFVPRLYNTLWRRSRIPGKSQIWESKIWSRVPRDSDSRKTTLAKASSIYKRQTCPLVRGGAPEKQDRNSQRVINIMGLDTKTYWLAVSRNVTLTLTRLE